MSRRLQWRNARKRHPAIYPALILAVAAFAAACSSAAARGLLQAAAAHWLITALIFAALCCTSVRRARHRAQQRQVHSWLAALPVCDRVLAAAVRAPASILGISVATLAVACCAGLSLRIAATVLLSIGGAIAVGSGVGWYWRQSAATTIPPSWYASVRGSPRMLWRASLSDLGTWPLACSQVWGRPKVTARQLAFLALGIPLGTHIIQALLVMGSALIVSYLLRLLAATARVAFPAARWLAPTPIRAAGLAAALIWLALLRQMLVIGLLLVFASALPLAVTAAQAATRGAMWLLLSLIISVTACLLAYAISSPDRASKLGLPWRRHRVHTRR